MQVVCEQGRVLRPLERGDWPALYALMRERKFPGVPEKATEAYCAFGNSTLLGLADATEGSLWAGFVFGPPEDGIAFFDVVCSRDAEGRWASPRLLKALFAHAFGVLKLRAVWVQPLKGKPLRAALKAGFIPVTPLDAKEPVLVMTPAGVPKRLCDF